MSNFIRRQSIVMIFLMLSFITTYGKKIAVKFTDPQSISTCNRNRFSASFKVDNHSSINLNIIPSISNQAIINCPVNTNQGVYLTVDSIVNGSSTGTFDSTDYRWKGAINIVSQSDSVKIFYSIYIDCASTPLTNINTSVSLAQQWIDPTNADTFDLQNGTNTYVPAQNFVKYLFFEYRDNLPSSVSYMDTVQLEFYYINSGTGFGNIKFAFYPDSFNYCGNVTTISINYRKGKLGTVSSYFAGQSLSDFINDGDTLIFTQNVRKTNCLDLNCTSNPTFKWSCDIPSGAMVSTFCSSCQNSIRGKVTLINAIDDNVVIEQLEGPSGMDFSCANDPDHMPL